MVDQTSEKKKIQLDPVTNAKGKKKMAIFFGAGNVHIYSGCFVLFLLGSPLLHLYLIFYYIYYICSVGALQVVLEVFFK